MGCGGGGGRAFAVCSACVMGLSLCKCT
jgi:hypothetical protein